MPDNEITEVPPHPRIGILVKTLLFRRPFRHVESIKLPKTWILQWIEIDIAMVPVSDPDVEELLDECNGLVNGLGGPGKKVRDLYPQKSHFFHEISDVRFCEFRNGRLPLQGLFDRLILDVSEVHPSFNRVAQILEIANQNVFA